MQVVFSQTTLLPDPKFERALVDMGIDSDMTVNGHIATADVLLVTELILAPGTIPNYPYASTDINERYIHDVTGIEAFVNLERLTLNYTTVDNLNLSTLTQLRFLYCKENALTALDLSNNPLLEYLNISNEGDVVPVINQFATIDLSQNPNINTLIANGIQSINLNNSNNNPDMYINVECAFCAIAGYPPDYIDATVCLKVDDVAALQSNALPYSAWNIQHAYIGLNYTNDLSQCSLSQQEFTSTKIVVYPNPNSSGLLYFSAPASCVVQSVVLYDYLGRKIREQADDVKQISLMDVQKGCYVLVLQTNLGMQRERVVVE
jgi:hypothetical protein